MDILQEYTTHIFHLYTSLEPYTRQPRAMLSSSLTSLSTHLTPYLDTLADTLSSSPALISVGILFLILIITLQVLNYMRRIMMWWFRLVLRLVFWSLVISVVAVVWQRGLGRTMNDVGAFWEQVRGVWWEEYRRWEGYNSVASGEGGGLAWNGSGGRRGGGRFETGNIGGKRGYGHR